MNSKAFYKSKAFYGCISTMVLIAGDMAVNGVNLGNISALAAAAFALYGRIVATAPLGMSDQSENDIEQARKDVRTSNKTVDADRGQG